MSYQPLQQLKVLTQKSRKTMTKYPTSSSGTLKGTDSVIGGATSCSKFSITHSLRHYPLPNLPRSHAVHPYSRLAASLSAHHGHTLSVCHSVAIRLADKRCWCIGWRYNHCRSCSLPLALVKLTGSRIIQSTTTQFSSFTHAERPR
jgi:hypothetical protein